MHGISRNTTVKKSWSRLISKKITKNASLKTATKKCRKFKVRGFAVAVTVFFKHRVLGYGPH